MTTRTRVVLSLALWLVSLTARADTITYVLTASNLGAGFAGPFATVTIGWSGDDPSNSAIVTFESMADSQFLYLMGGQGAAALNVAGGWAIGPATGTNTFSGFTPGPYIQGAAGNEDGFGSFNLTVDSFDGFTHSATEIVFTLTNTTGTWADAASVLAPNAQGEIAAIHAFACVNSPDPCDVNNDAVVTGYASGAVLVPEPATALLLGTAVVGIRLRRRQRFVTRT